MKQVNKPSPPLRVSQGTFAFTEHLQKIFQPHPSENESTEEEALIQLLDTPYQLKPLRNYQVTTSSLVTFLKNYLLLE
jgi:hypothetical protein